ncbi:MAG: NAD(P)H nitroreductase [Magnetospirillum sp.]
MDALKLLLERRSCHALQVPGPQGESLRTILRAGLRVPDFQSLRPYEFVVAEGEGLDRLGELFAQAARAAGKSDEMVERAKRMPHRAPVVITVIARHKASQIVRPLEQHLSAGCAVMAMQMAALAQGFAGVWRSGWLMFDPTLHQLLGLRPDDQIVGFLYLGTQGKPYDKPLSDPEPAEVTRWL